MKLSTPLLGLALVAIATAVAQAQTLTFVLSNLNYKGASREPIYDAAGNLLTGSAYLAQLYVGKDRDSLQPLLPVAPFLTGPLAGFVSQTIEVDNPLGGFNSFSYQIRAWDASLGSTYAEATAQGRGGVGESNVASEAPGFSGSIATTPGPVIGLQFFSLSPLIVPEPSTYALLGLGVVALGWQRRRSGRARSGPASQ